MIDDLWYKNGVFYCLSVGTYMDANGDGIGDFKGLLRRLDYLSGLGVTAIWLMPFQPSPGKDDGYDIADYYGVDPRYGTLGDFVEFMQGCRQRGMRVLIDMVARQGREGVVLSSLLRLSARPQYGEPACAGRDPQDHGVLAPTRRFGISHGCRSLCHRNERRRRQEAHRAIRHAA